MKLIKSAEEFKLDNNISKILVRGIVNGNRQYADERAQKKDEMIVSSGYQWIRSNKIDDAIHKELLAEKATNIDDKVSKAGPSWEYVQFMFKSQNALLIVKRGKSIIAESKSIMDDNNCKKQYMNHLTEINNRNFINDNNEESTNKQLVLFDDMSINNTMTDKIIKEENIDKFYVLTYGLNSKSEINSVQLWMPNPINKKTYLIQDLSDFIGDEAALNDKQIAAVKNDTTRQLSAYEDYYDISLLEEDQDEDIKKY